MATDVLYPDSRLEALRASHLLDSPPEEIFDRLTALARRVLNVPVTLISLIDSDRQFFKSQQGLGGAAERDRQTPLSQSFCQHVVASGEPLVVNDARRHELVADNAAVPELGVIAYAGVPVMDAMGHHLGALCAIDAQPREWTREEVDILRALAAQANTEISLRALAEEQQSTLQRVKEESGSRLARVRDLRQPLEALLLSVQALDYVGPLNEVQRECLRMALRDGAVLRERVEEAHDVALVDRAGPAALERETLAPHYLVATATERCRPFAEQRGVKLRVNVARDLPAFPVDGEKVSRVLSTLLTTAVALTRRGGVVEVDARADGAGQVTVSLAAAPPPPAGTESARESELGFAFAERVAVAHGGRFLAHRTSAGCRRFEISLPTVARESLQTA